MTEELKQKAKKWVKDNTRIEHSASFGEIKVEPSAEKGYIAGATENGTQWHDLRKDPSDLPKKVGNYIVCYLDTMLERHSFELSYVDYLVDRHWIDEDNHEIETYDEGVIAWC